jgi:FKBP-type peptidyl-prolyl cis-trans isomerase FklB
MDGKEFDSSYGRGEPAIFRVNQVIKGWTQALQMMKEGGRWQIIIPPDLGYGAMGAGNVIPPNATLNFEVELIKVIK